MKLDTYDAELGARIVADWTEFALGGSTDIDLEAVADGLDLLYAGKAPPFVVFDSPLALQYAAALLRDGGTNVWANVRANVQANVVSNVRDNVLANVQANVVSNVLDNVLANIRANVRASRLHYEHPSWAALEMDAAWGAYASYWIAVGATSQPNVERYLRWLRSGAWSLLAFEGIALVSRRPEVVRRDAAGRLHCEDGPAMRFRDAYAVYAWHGTLVPAEWIEARETLSAATALTWENVEQRRAAAEIVGWSRIMTEVGARVVQRDEFGELLEAELPNSGRELFVRVQCGTGRVFVLPVPPEMTTCLEAVAWSYGVEPEVYRGLEVRT